MLSLVLRLWRVESDERGKDIRRRDLVERYKEYLPRVLNYIRLWVDDEDVAQDLTAAVFERAVAQLHTLRSEEAFGAWLFRIARHIVVDYYRRHRTNLPLDEVVDEPSPDPSPEAQVLQADEVARLLDALATLSAREQEIIRLRFVAGLKNREIAELLGLTETNVAVILFRALRKLRQVIGE